MTSLAPDAMVPVSWGGRGARLQLSHPEGNLREVSQGGCPSFTPTRSPCVPTEPASPEPGMPGLSGFASLLPDHRTSVRL